MGTPHPLVGGMASCVPCSAPSPRPIFTNMLCVALRSDAPGHTSTRESGTGLKRGLDSILLLRTVGPGVVTPLWVSLPFWDVDTMGPFAPGAGR